MIEYKNNLNEEISDVILLISSYFNNNISIAGSCMFKILNIFNRSPGDIDIIIFNTDYFKLKRFVSSYSNSTSSRRGYSKLSITINNINIDFFYYDNKLPDNIGYIMIDNKSIYIDHPINSINAKLKYITQKSNLKNIIKHYSDIENYNFWAEQNSYEYIKDLDSLSQYLKYTNNIKLSNYNKPQPSEFYNEMLEEAYTTSTDDMYVLRGWSRHLVRD